MKFLLLIGVLLVAAELSTATYSSLNQPRKRKQFGLGGGEMNWYKALEHCHRVDMELVSISSQEELDDLMDWLTSNCIQRLSIWTSGEDFSEEGTFSWISTGREFNYTNWASGQPDNNNGNENCVYLTNSEWYDGNCKDRHNVICEKIIED